MMAAAAPARRNLLARIHIARKEMGLDEETYRDLLRRETGASSAAALDDAGLEKALAAFRRMGWRPRRWRPASRKPWVRKVYALWGEAKRAGVFRDRRRSALRAFCKRQTGVEDPEWLTPQQAARVTEAFKAMISRAREEK
jgi:phage gp16-like protein